jgi:2-methylcitrate dehydratase
MNEPVARNMNKAVDSIQQRLTDYACGLNYDSLTPEAIHAVKVRVIDTLGALIGGFFGESCHIARNLAAQMPNPDGATVIGTRLKTTPDMAAFVNGTTARDGEMNDFYYWPGSGGGHPSDILAPVLAAAEHARVSGREFITGIALAYEVYARIADNTKLPGFDTTNYMCLGSAVAAGKLLGLSPNQLSHCISMAIVPNNSLGQARTSHLSMWKAVAAGQAGRAGMFAALLARAGMEGPHLPFEGKAGWCDHVAGKRFSLTTMGGDGTPFKVSDTIIKIRSTCASTISSALAAEKVAPLRNIKDVKQVIVELYEKAKSTRGTGEQHWNPDKRDTADHSIPYVVGVTLMDGTVTRRSFDDAHLWNPELRALLKKIELVENKEFTAAHERLPVEHRTRVTVVTNGGERLVGETGGDKGELSEKRSDAWIEEKFRSLAEDFLGTKRVNSILDRLWHLEEMGNITEIPPAFVLD